MESVFKTQNVLSQHPEPRLQWAWNCAQVGLFLFPWLPNFGVVGLLLAVGGAWQQKHRTIIQCPLNWGLALLGSWLILTCCLARDRLDAFLGLANLFPYFLVFAGLSALIQRPDQLRQLARILVVGSLPVVILGLGQLFLGWAGVEALQGVFGWLLVANGNPPGRMASVFMYTNILAVYLLIVLILGLGLWLETFQGVQQRPNRSSRWMLVGLSVLVVGDAIALFLTSSRNVWGIAFLACLAFALYLGWYWLVLGVSAAAGTILWASFGPMGRQSLRRLVPAYFWARLSDELYPGRPTAFLRTTQWQFAWNMTQERPWLGWGLRSFTPLYEAQMGVWLGHPHNLLLMLTAETGIPATLLFVGLVGWIMAQGSYLLGVWSAVAPLDTKANWHQDKLIFFTYLLAFGGCSLFNLLDVTLFDFRANTLGWLLLAAICGVVEQYQAIPRGQRVEMVVSRD